jgi:hypothetical protein
MRNHRTNLIPQSLWLAGLLFGTLALVPVAAQAQAHGTLQAYAQVVDTKVSSAGLQAARQALQGALNPSATQHDAVSTLAHVSVAQATEQRTALLVTIDYSKN